MADSSQAYSRIRELTDKLWAIQVAADHTEAKAERFLAALREIRKIIKRDAMNSNSVRSINLWVEWALRKYDLEDVSRERER